jgi:hypothetical protein
MEVAGDQSVIGEFLYAWARFWELPAQAVFVNEVVASIDHAALRFTPLSA